MTDHAEAHLMRRLVTADEDPARTNRLALADARTLGRLDSVLMDHGARHAGTHPKHDPGCQLCVLLLDLHDHLDGGGDTRA